jgi:hypothetical protein
MMQLSMKADGYPTSDPRNLNTRMLFFLVKRPRTRVCVMLYGCQGCNNACNRSSYSLLLEALEVDTQWNF